MLVYLSCFIVLLSITYTYFSTKKSRKSQIPLVEGCYPVVGHGLTFSKDIIGFIRGCYNKYGKIFELKIFNRRMAVICDRELIDEFFKTKEEHFSLYDVLTDLFFADAFSDDPSSISYIISIVKKTVSIRFDEVVPKIKDEAQRMIGRLSERVGKSKKINISDEMIKFVACTSARCFIGLELDEYVYDVLMRFTHRLNKLVVLTYFLPRYVIQKIAYFYIRPLRKQMTGWLKDEVKKYRDDPNKRDSMIFRESVDYTCENGNKLTDDEIGDVIVCLLYVSSENTALGLNAAIVDLVSHHDKFLHRAQIECIRYLKNNDIRGLLSSPFIDACVMESARMNTHIFALNRKPKSKEYRIGNYTFEDIDCIALCEPMLMLHEGASDTFSNPLEYNPDRFMSPINESKAATSVMTWGAGVHLCPGKMFAIYEIKIALAMMITNFHFDIPDVLPPLDYFSPSAFSERSVEMTLTKTNFDYDFDNNMFVYTSNGTKAYLLRQFYTKEECTKLDKYIFGLTEFNIPEDLTLVRPIAYDNLVYTGGSNCSPDVLYSESKKIADKLNGIVPNKLSNCNSMYSQIFMPNSKMEIHKDQYVDWGISISLGASSVFLFGDDSITLNSGDVLITDFSAVEHGIKRIISSEEYPYRVSVQLRRVDKYPDMLLSESDFIKMIN